MVKIVSQTCPQVYNCL